MNFKRRNLNLLVHLESLLSECSVSRAAEKSHLSQTAMSAILKQLRVIFDDPLFIREPHGLKPTPKALALLPKVKNFLTYADELYRDEEFDPSTETATFNFILGSHAEHLILSKLTSYLAQHAPNFKLNNAWITPNLDLDKELAANIDLAIGADFLPHGTIIKKDFLLHEEMVCAVRKNHPFANQELTQEMFSAAEHVNIQFIEKAINTQSHHVNLTRDIKIIVPNLISALEVIRDTDYLALVPYHLADYLNNKADFVIKKIPFADTNFTINIFYHARFINHKPLQWIIKVIKEQCLQVL